MQSLILTFIFSIGLLSVNLSTPASATKFRPIKTASLKAAQLKTFVAKHPKLYKAIKADRNSIQTKNNIMLYKAEGIILLTAGKLKGGPISVQYEEFPAGQVGDVLVVAICQCDEGRDDCQFYEDNQGNLECLSSGGECSECEQGFEFFAPDGSTYMTPF